MIPRLFPQIEPLLSLFCPECKSTYDDEGLRVCPHDGTSLYAVSNEPDLAGTIIDGRFRVDKLIGHGGMGTVYDAQQLSVGRQVAVKVLRRDLHNREIALERFFREAKTISGLSHPNIVRLIDFGQDRDRDLLYLVMEYVRGANLGDLIEKGRMRIALALEILYQVCGALTEPHALDVIHRDLKPDNLLLVPVSDGSIQAKVLDFGISRALESKTHLTGSGMICGTPAYMAPEQAQNEDLDARADIYALGVILYEMVSGWPPFVGTSSLQIMLKHIAEEPRPLRELIPPATLPPEVEQLVYELMSKDRNDRPNDVHEVRNKIDAIRKSFGLEIPKNSTPGDMTFGEFMLPKLPEGRSFASSPTEALRRETGLELWATRADSSDSPPKALRDTGDYDTEAEPGLGPTQPLTPEGHRSVALDIQGGSTRDGGQQAWTPSEQEAVRRIADTKESEIDPLAKTSATPSTVRPASRPKTQSTQSPAQPNLADAPKSNVSLFVTIFVLIVLVGGGAIYTASYIQDKIAENKNMIADVVEVPVPVETVVEKGLDPKQLDMVRATTFAQSRLSDAVVSGDSKARASYHASKVEKKRVDPIKTKGKPTEKKDPEIKKTVKKTKTEEETFDFIRNKLRDDEME